jgi:hypothetical protein
MSDWNFNTRGYLVQNLAARKKPLTKPRLDFSGRRKKEFLNSV